MAIIHKSSKPLAVQPLKSGQPLGGVLAALGIERSIPLIHGAQGCAAFAKVFFVQHFREPIPLQSTAMDPITTVMGADGNLADALAYICDKHQPKLILLLTSGLSEAQGADIKGTLKLFNEKHVQDKTAIVAVNTPDFYGSLETGYASVVEALIEQLVPVGQVRQLRKKRVNFVLSHTLTSADIDLLRRYCEGFGLQPIFLPDLSQSMDGCMRGEDFTPLTRGGISVNQIRQLHHSAMTIVVGASLQSTAGLIRQRCEMPVESFTHLMTLEQVDRLVMLLSEISGRPVPKWIAQERGRVCDALIDTHPWVNGRRAVIASESDGQLAWSELFRSVGIEIAHAVAPVNQPPLTRMAQDNVHLGDLEDVADAIDAKGADLLVANSHAARVAEHCQVPLLRFGFPVIDRFGGADVCRIGYGGMRASLFEIANQMHDHHQPVAPYISKLGTGSRAPESVAAGA